MKQANSRASSACLESLALLQQSAAGTDSDSEVGNSNLISDLVSSFGEKYLIVPRLALMQSIISSFQVNVSASFISCDVQANKRSLPSLASSQQAFASTS